MDQDTSNSPGKARWRERLGMGNTGRELPKISDEFKPASTPPRETKPPPASLQGYQPVTRPAPMAPRTPPQATAPRPPQQASTPRPVAPVPQGASGLGDRLRAERQAAERLAEQRVAQARGRIIDRPAAPPPAPPPPSPVPQAQRPQAPQVQVQKPAGSDKPKFSFSPEELAKDKRETQPPEREFPTFSGKSGMGASPPPPPLTPPRPALGGNAAAQPQRPQPSPPKPPSSGPASPGFQPRYGGQPQAPGGNYRSLDPPGGLPPRPKPYADTASFRDDPLARRAPPVNREYDSYRKGPALPPQQAFGDESEGPSLGDYRRRQQFPARARQPAYDHDVNEVFEDEEPPRPRRRASAQDYNRAYRDYEEGYESEAPRRRGPWPWLLGILAALVIAGAVAVVVYYYLTYYKQGQTSSNVPTIEAPQQPAKAPPDSNTSGSTQGTLGDTQPTETKTKTKEIYDRILGDDEVNGNQVVPTQEQPQAVEPTGNIDKQAQPPVPGPTSGTQNNSTEPLPLPLPPPGANEPQGSLPVNTNQQTAGLAAPDKTTPPSPSPEPASASAPDSSAPVPGQLPKASDQTAATPPPPPSIEQVANAPEPVPEPKPDAAKPKLKPEKKLVKKVAAVEDTTAQASPDTGQNGAVEPLVLVPPAQSATSQAQITQPDAATQAATETPAPEQKSKSFFDFGSTGKRKLTGKAAENADARGTGSSGNWTNSPAPGAASADSSGAPPQQVASVAPEPEAQPIPTPAPEPQQPAPQAKSTAGGYVAQLASFRSEAEAMAEFDRLRAKHGNVLNGLAPHVVKATVAGSARYRLAVGPLATRAAASKVCNSLIAGGERDCLVRPN